MTIGVNWKEIWAAVWKDVWRQTAPVVVASTDDEKLSTFRKRIAPKRPLRSPNKRVKAVAKKQEVKKVRVRKPRVKKVVAPPAPVEVIEEKRLTADDYSKLLSPRESNEIVIESTLEGCGINAEAAHGTFATISASLEGCQLHAVVALSYYDDSVSMFMRMPELEPEVVEV